MLALLEKGDLPGDRGTSEGGKPSESVRDVRDLLLSSVRPGANYRQFSLALDGLERVLAAQLVVIGASPNSDAQEPPPAQAVPVEEMSALNLRDSALLAALTEKFYRSAAFKIMGGGLVAAALLAGGGALFIGGQSVNLRNDLNNTASEASTRIEKKSQTFEWELEQKKIDLNEEVKKQINDKASPLLQKIEEETQGVLTRITPKISELEASVDRLRSRRDAVSTSLAELEPISKQVGPLKLKIASASDYTKAAQDAQQAAQAAGRSEQQAKAYGDATLQQLTALYTATPQESARLSEMRKQIDAQQVVLTNEIMPNIKKLREDLSVARPALCDLPALSNGPDALRTQLDCLKQRIADIEAQAPEAQAPVKQNVSLTEADLSTHQWSQIQQVLVSMHLYTGKVNGKQGSWTREFKKMSKTRQAIFKWQGVLPAPQDGRLTPEQIQQLLASVPTMR